MASTITYPHVGTTVKALQRRAAASAVSTATTLLAPFMCDRGPENQLVAIDSMSQFVQTFGSLDYSNEHQRQIINIGNWLGDGGRVLACRLTTTRDAIVNSEYLIGGETVSSESLGTVKPFNWAISDSKKATDPAFSVSYGSDLLTVTMDRINYTIALTSAAKTSLSTTLGRSENRDHVDSFINSGVDASKFALNIPKNLEASVSESGSVLHLVLTNKNTDASTYLSFDTGIAIAKPDSLTFGSETLTAASNAGFSGTIGSVKITAKAKYPGSYYNRVSVSLSSDGPEENAKTGVWSMYFDVTIYVTISGVKKAVERYSNVEFGKIYTISDNSDYIDDIRIFSVVSSTETEITDLTNEVCKGALAAFSKLEITGSGGNDGSLGIEDILVGSLTDILKKPLETPFDVMIDCGYSKQVKLDLIKLFCSTSTDINDVVRNDAFLYLTVYKIEGKGRTQPTKLEAKISELRPDNSRIDGVECDLFNMAVIDQFEKVQDIYSENSGREIFVPTTAFIAGLQPANDAKNGVQFPLAGLTRGVIKGALWINELPTSAEKQDKYDNHLNYIEKDDRGVCIMTQVTGTLDDTRLASINNARSLLKMKKQLTLIGRQYLHEFNDRITKTNLQNALDTYLSDWIQNRTLEFGYVTLTDSTDNQTLADNEINIGLTVKFLDTIDVISIDIVVE